jgi:hypothetical protein
VTLSPNHVIAALAADRDALSIRCSEIAAELTKMERQRDEARITAQDALDAALRQRIHYDAEFLDLRERHATAVFAVQELTAALRDMTVRALGQELGRKP